MITYSGGSFDVLHAGHVHLLRECRKLAGLGGKVVVALNTDEFITTYKGAPPICSYLEREEVLRALRDVDDVVPNESGADSKPTILKVHPDWIAIGEDWARRDYYSQMGFTRSWLGSQGISLVYIPHLPMLSSSIIKQRVREA